MNAKRKLGLMALVAALSLTADTQAQVSPGFRLFGPLGGTDTYLVDKNGVIVQTWPSTLPAGAGVYLLDDGSLLRAGKTAGAPAIGGAGGAVTRVDLAGNVLWEFHYSDPQHWLHHDLEPMPNGNVLMIAWQNKTVTEALAAGRDPALVQGAVMRPDSIIEVAPMGPFSGTVVWQWNVWDHLVQDRDPSLGNHGVIADHPELVDINYPPLASGFGDWNHMNSVKYDAVHDQIIMSARAQSEIWVIDHSTTTAEAASHSGGAAGKGGDLLYRFGNPEAYQRGGPVDRAFFGQHCARVIPPGYPGAGNYTVFNNVPPSGDSTVWEFSPPRDASGNFILAPGAAYGPSSPVWTFSQPGILSPIVSSAERLPNGNTLMCSGSQGIIGEVTPAGGIVWLHQLGPVPTLVFHAHYYERTLWSSKPTVSASAGGTVTFDVIAGNPYVGRYYLLLASASGTAPGIVMDGITFPLNFDPLLEFTFLNANSSILDSTLGVLDARGRATATLSLPPQAAGPGLVHFAVAIADLGPTLVSATNPVPLLVLP